MSVHVFCGYAKRRILRWIFGRLSARNLSVYRCPHCGQFHIGHKPGTKKAAA